MAKGSVAHTGQIGVGGNQALTDIVDSSLGENGFGGGAPAATAPNQIQEQVVETSGSSLLPQDSTSVEVESKQQPSRVFQPAQTPRVEIPESTLFAREQKQAGLQAELQARRQDQRQQQQKLQQPSRQQPQQISPNLTQKTSREVSFDDFNNETASDLENTSQLNKSVRSASRSSLPTEALMNLPHSTAPTVSRSVSMEDTSRLTEEQSSQNSHSNDDNIVDTRRYDPVKKQRIETVDVEGSSFAYEREAKNQTSSAVANKNWTGNGFSEKVVASRDVEPEDVSVGTQVIAALVREPGNNLVEIVNNAANTQYTVNQLLDENVLIDFCNVINSNRIYVVASKSPIPNPSSSQQRRLVTHYGRGVKVHPTQTKIYNLDFDGDGVSIQFELDGSLFRNAMAYLINEMDEPMIDLSFFPMAKLSENEEQFIRDFNELFLAKLSWTNDLTDLARSFFYVSNPTEDPNGRSEKELLSAFIREMDAVASNYQNKYTVLSYMLKDIFDQMLILKQIQAAAESEAEVYSDLIEETDIDEYLHVVIKDISNGHLPPNFHDFLAGLNRYVGDIEGKNVMFRLGADIAKRIKFSGETVMGVEGARELYERTLEAGMSKFMSGRANIGEKIGSIQHIARNIIISHVGFPSSVSKDGTLKYSSLQEWANDFVAQWNYFQGMIDAANVQFGCDLDPVYNSISDSKITAVSTTVIQTKNGQKNIGIYKIDDLKNAITAIYGDYTIEKMFPTSHFDLNYKEGLKVRLQSGTSIDAHLKGRTLLPRYKNMTLMKLSQDNRISSGENFSEKLKDVTTANNDPLDIILAIADKKTSAASKFNEELDELLENFSKGLAEFEEHYKKRNESPIAFVANANDIMSCLHLSGPDMFAYFGMNDPSTFLNSKYGNLLQQAARIDKDHVGGVRISMVVQYRMRVIQNINAEINRLLNKESNNLLYTIPRVNELQNRIQNELDILGSSSDLWRVLAQEVNGDTSAFNALKESEGDSLGFWMVKDAKQKEVKHSWLDAPKFWIQGKALKYNSLMEVLSDPSLTKTEKESIAADVIRQATGFVHIKKYEINYQLEIGPHSNHVSLSTMAYRDQPNIISDIEKANNRFKLSFKNNWKEFADDVAKTRAMSSSGDLESYIVNLADNPELYMSIDDNMVVDAINAQMDKSSRSSEKAHQEIPVDALYNAISMQKGGLTNAMYRSDARVLGMIPESDLTAYDLIDVLAHPEKALTVYNGTKRYLFSRAALCGDNSEEALWDMLERNPRIASLLRPGIATVSKDGTVYRNAAYASFGESFNSVIGPVTEATGLNLNRWNNSRQNLLKAKVKSTLIDRPVFLGLVAMMKPISGRSSRSVRQQTKDVMNTLQSIIIGYAARIADGENLVSPARIILQNMDISVETLQKIGGMDEEAALNWYGALCESLNRYVSEVATIIKKDDLRSFARAIYKDGFSTKLSFDRSSVSLAIDVRQTMTGAKTETSTAVEGNMTQANLGLGLFAMATHDEFTVIDGDMSEEELAPFIGCMTNAGLFDGTNIEQLESSLAQDVPLVVQMPEDMIRQDSTLDDDESFQISSLGRALITKRTRAAEEYNLKAKKSGDDGLDSITKSSRFIDDADKNIGIIENVYENEGRLAAVFKLAQILQANDAEEGYKDMDLADYANLASIMVKEITDDTTNETTIVIRSLGEISLAIRSNMDPEVVAHGTPKEKISNAFQIADEVGVQSMIQTEYLSAAALLAASSIPSNINAGTFRPAKNAAMSSPDRSFRMLERVAGLEKNLKLPWGGTISEKPSRSFLTKGNIRSLENHVNKYTSINVFKSNYNFIGLFDGKHTKKGISPGQLSVWLIEPGATQDEIDSALKTCYAYGMTLAFSDISMLGNKAEYFEKDVTPAPFDDNYIMLPFFDMRMNRSHLSAPMSPASFQYDPSWLWYSVEDSRNLYGLGDADSLISGSATERAQCVAGGQLSLKMDNLFYNTRAAEPDRIGEPQWCSAAEIEEAIVNWLDDGPTIDFGRIEEESIEEQRKGFVDKLTSFLGRAPKFDFGITDSNPNYERVLQKFGLQLEEYRRNFDMTDERGFLATAKPDQIVGWVKCNVKGYEKPVYAPVIPFPTGTSLKAPTQFDIDRNYHIDLDTDSIVLPWRISEDIEGQVCKVHDGMGAAGKSFVCFSRDRDLGSLRHGVPIDMVTAAESFASRRLAWGKRMCTLKSLALVMSTPPYGYNYADHPSSFPDNPEIKEQLRNGRIPMEEWVTKFGSIKRFSNDLRIDTMLREIVELALKAGTNPSDILATKYHKDGNPDIYEFSYMYVDYDFFFDTSINFQNTLMAWYNSMQPDVCPPSIDDYYNRSDGKGYLFKPVTEGKDNEIGCLQMAVPHKHPKTGKTFYHWENVYVSFSFFNDDYSGLHKVGLNGANRTMEQLNAMAISGKPLSGKNMQLYTENTAALSFRPMRTNDIELDYDKFITKER